MPEKFRRSTVFTEDNQIVRIRTIVTPVEVHRDHCQLPRETLLQENREILAKYSQDNNKYTRWFNELTLISRANPLTEKYFRSETAVSDEKIRHIRLNYWYIVHPLSKLRIYFEIWQLVLYLIMLIVKPMNAAVPTTVMWDMAFFPEFSTILDLLSWVTIILTFFNGYIIQSTRTMVLEPKRIAWHYISSIYFTCDVLSSIPVFPVVHFVEILMKTRHVMGVGVLYLFCELKLIRIISVIQYINNFSIYLRIKAKGSVFLLMCVIVTLFTVHNFALLQLLVPKLIRGFFTPGEMDRYLWFVKYNLQDKPFSALYSQCVFRSSAFILAIRVDMYGKANEVEDYVLAMITYAVGKILICTTYVILALALLSNKSMDIKFHSIIDQLDEYMNQKQLPLNLREKIKKFYYFKYQGKYFKEAMINDMLPAKLKKDVSLHVSRTLVKNVSIFADLTAEQISNVIELLTSEIFLPKDTIFQSGSYGDTMYFISSGTVAIYTHSGREVCHLEDGAYFGELALVLKIHERCATVVAIETTHVYVLKKKDFNMCLLKHPKVMKKIRKLAQTRFDEIRKYEKGYKRMLFEQEHSGHDDSEIDR